MERVEMSDSEKIAREIVARIRKYFETHHGRVSDAWSGCSPAYKQELVAEWVALVTPVIEEAQRDHHENWPDCPSCVKAANDDFAAAEAYSRMEQRAQAAEKEREDWKQAALTNNETIGLLGDQKAALKAEVERLKWFEPALHDSENRTQRLLATEERLTQRVRELEAGLGEIATLVLDPHAAASFTYSNLCEAVGRSRSLLSQPPAPQPSEPAAWTCERPNCGAPAFTGTPTSGTCQNGHRQQGAPSEPTKDDRYAWFGWEVDADLARAVHRLSEPAPPTTTPARCEDQNCPGPSVCGLEMGTCDEPDPNAPSALNVGRSRCGNPLPCNLHPEGR